MKVYNFAAGPSMLAEEVKLEAQRDFLNYNNSGMSVTEMSHRSKVFEAVNSEAQSLLRELMGISDDYYVLFLQGGASTQFEAVPLNLLSKGKADYIVTGNFASKAASEAKKYGDIAVVATSKDKNHTYIPEIESVAFRDGIDYAHITSNNTIFGTKYTRFPTLDAPLVCDMSSNILSETVDVNKFGLIYAGAQKNIAPAGLTIVIVKKSLTGKAMPICPTMLRYDIHAENSSLYNTPPAFCIYMAMLTFRWIKKLGGVSAIQQINEYKAGKLYDYIDDSGFFKNPVVPQYRSLMNVPFTTPSQELDAKFVAEASKNGLVALAGHRSVGGMRASIYNAMPIEGVDALIKFMKSFAKDNK